MAEVKKIATRVSYGETLVELGAIDERVVAIDADLAGSTQTGMFKKTILALLLSLCVIIFTNICCRKKTVS